MFDKELYKKEIYEKYSKEQNINEKFDGLNNNYYKRFPIIAIIVVLCISITTFAYNEITNHKSKYVPEQTKSVWKEEYQGIGVLPENFECETSNLVNYKVIDNYDNYINESEKLNSPLEMSEDDFKDNFILIVNGQYCLQIDNIYNYNSKMYVELRRLKENNIDEVDTNWIIAKVSKMLYKDEIIFKVIPELNGFSGYEDIFKLDKDYKIKDAITDNCVTIKNNEKLDEFIEKTESDEENSIRVFRENEEYRTFVDLYYKNGMYYMCEYNEYLNDEHQTYTRFYTGNKIYKGKKADGNSFYFLCYAENGKIKRNQWIIL